jgi:hypothetical protein
MEYAVAMQKLKSATPVLNAAVHKFRGGFRSRHRRGHADAAQDCKTS